ncbi:beta-1,3-galactosyltransferase 6 isoform X1 [Bombyx mori]|uniref:Hexosyltransferase n=1 Tax=Bombyx mori TaxID=7091 RepID=A0A8R1WIP6_BOMMO|nr:beta-1,3-galactosyltransferase 6 isoform X1 [Bombyx mori]
MLVSFIRKFKIVILFSLFFFYLGCGITLSLIRLDCADAVTKTFKSDPDITTSSDGIEYAVLVFSGPENKNKRDAIRSTWAKLANNIFKENGEKLYKWNHTKISRQNQQNIIKLYFVIGLQKLSLLEIMKLNDENSRSNDMLLIDDLQDSYDNLTSKVLKALKWFSENLKNLRYLIKCDDDSFVRIDLIVRDLEAFAPKMDGEEIKSFVSYKVGWLKSHSAYNGLYWGYFSGKAKVFMSGKWKETDWFLCDNYLPYARGGGYVISRSIVDFVGKNAELLSHYNSEDVSMGVWTAPLDRINRVHDVRFDTEWKTRGCLTNMLVRHKQTPSDMFQLFKNLINSHGNKLCKHESTERKSYHYNWNVLPSECCH